MRAYEIINEGVVKVRDFKEWMTKDELVWGSVLERRISDSGGLTRFIINCNKWRKSLSVPLQIFRGLDVPNPHEWVTQHIREVGYDLGTHWTDVFEIAFNQNGPGGSFNRGRDTNLIICATADEAAIDWCSTYAIRAVDRKEPEIKLLKGAYVNVSEILVVDTTNSENPDGEGFRFGQHNIVKSIPVNKSLKI